MSTLKHFSNLQLELETKKNKTILSTLINKVLLYSILLFMLHVSLLFFFPIQHLHICQTVVFWHFSFSIKDHHVVVNASHSSKFDTSTLGFFFLLVKPLQQGLENRGQVYFWKSAYLKNVHFKV